MSSTSWAFDHLNQLTPDQIISPSNGPSNELERNEFNFSLPVSNLDLHSQLEQWTNVTFDFDLPPLDLDYNLNNNSSYSPSDELNSKDELLLLQQQQLNQLKQLNSITTTTSSSSSIPSTSNTTQYSSALNLGGSFNHSNLGSYTDSNGLDTLTRLTNYNIPISTPFIPYNELHLPIVPTPSTSTSSSSSTTPIASSNSSTKPVNVKKRKQSISGQTDIIGIVSSNNSDEVDEFPALVLGNDEAANAIAIEEDKRRRNTAASARFRIKKKQREAELQSSAKGLKDRVAELEKEVATLKTENALLQGLLLKKDQLEAGSQIKPEEKESILATST